MFRFPFDVTSIPPNGIYLLFQAGEHAHGGNRIVRVGTHNGSGRLGARLKEHFMTENKDRSIFRKNIGRALLSEAKDPYLDVWEYDLTSRQGRAEYGKFVDPTRQNEIEGRVSQFIQENFSFVVLPVDGQQERLELESKIISTLFCCADCQPSENWIGQCSPKKKIRESGLWLVNNCSKQPLSEGDLNWIIKQ